MHAPRPQMHAVLFCHLPIQREANTFCLIGKQHIIVRSDEGPKETQSISSYLLKKKKIVATSF